MKNRAVGETSVVEGVGKVEVAGTSQWDGGICVALAVSLPPPKENEDTSSLAAEILTLFAAAPGLVNQRPGVATKCTVTWRRCVKN